MNMSWLYRLIYRHWPLRKGRTRVLRAAWGGVRGMILARDDFGHRFLLDLSQFIDCHLYLDGSFEKEDVLALRELAGRYGCRQFIDIGANLGVFSVTLGSLPGIEQVHSFEPDPRNHAQLMANIFLNGLYEKVKPWSVALSDAPGEADFYPAQARRDSDLGKLNRGTSSLIYSEARHARPIRVPLARLDDLLPLTGEAVVIKIDVEGHEPAVLRGMQGFLAANRCVIHVESFPGQKDEADTLLRSLGYRPLEEYHLEGHNHIYARAES